MEINQELMREHWAEMRKLFKEQVKDIRETDPDRADENFERLVKEERVWLKDHPDCPRYFASINPEVNEPQFIFPDATKVPCRDCIFVGKNGPTNAFCKVYRDPNMKPNNVLWGKNARCEYRVTKKQAEKTKKNKDEKEKK